MLAGRMLPRLFEVRLLVRNALNSIGGVLSAKVVVEIAPAITGTFVSIDIPSSVHMVVEARVSEIAGRVVSETRIRPGYPSKDVVVGTRWQTWP